MSAPGSPDAPAPDTELRAARRALTLFVVAVAAGAIGLIVLLTGVADEDGGDTTVGTGDDEAPAAIGPDDGAEVAAYVDARRRRLTEVDGRRAAVVSFSDYVSEAAAVDLLGDGLDVEGLLMALPGDEGRLVESVDDERARVVADAESQLAEISGLVPTVDDEDFAEFYRSELLRYRKIIDGAERDDVVFGAVVVGRAADLRALGSRAGVRLVDVGSSADPPGEDSVAGLRPEESITAGEPQFRP